MTISKREPAPAVTVTLGYSRDDDWRAQSACVGADPELFFPEGRAQQSWVEEAKAVCRSCAVLAECRETVLAHPDLYEYGVFGGLDETERKALTRGKAAS